MIIDKLPLPTENPTSHFDWKSLGEALFWLKNIDNNVENILMFSEDDFRQAFESLDSKTLSKLMLGMYYYSSQMDEIRNKNIKHFINRIKSDFDIIHLSIDNDEVNVHYIIDVLNNDGKRSTNDFAVSILQILRTALPNKKQFYSQGYGHRLQTLNVDYDDTHKTIAIENLPLEEWVRINSTIIELYEYQYRPTDWNEYRIELNNWEDMINLKTKEFNNSFNLFLKGSKTYAPLTPILQNLLFTRSEKIEQPKSITDSLGIFNFRRQNVDNKNEKENINTTLYSKYEKFFKSLSEFKGSIEAFVSQSAQTLNSRAKLLTKEDHIHDENVEYLSQTNLYDAIKKLKEFNNQYELTFSNIDANHVTKISNNSLLTAAVFWKDFLNSNYKGQHSHNRILKLKSDFENKIIKDCKCATKNKLYSIIYKNNAETDDKPVLIINSETPFWSLIGFTEAYKIVQDAIGFPEYNSLKYMMLQTWFSETYFVQTILGRTTNNQLNEIKLYILKDKSIDEISVVNLALQSVDIFPSLNIDSWSRLIPDFNVIVKISEAYSKMILLVDHYYDLRFLSETQLEENDEEKLLEYLQGLLSEIQDCFQTILDALFLWIQMFPFDEDAYINSEEEQEYFKALINVKDNIYPQPRGDDDSEDYQACININVIEEWVERLKICSTSWGVFLLLLYGKYINKYNQA